MGNNIKVSLISWIEIWSNIYKAETSLEIKSAVYSQIHLGFYSEYLLVRNRTLNSLFCTFCGKLVLGLNHWILHWKTLFDALDYFQPLISELGQAELDQRELVFGLQEKCNRQMLRNLITFSIQFSVHKNRGTALKNPNSAKTKVINMAKLKIRKQIWDQFHFAMDKCESDELVAFPHR